MSLDVAPRLGTKGADSQEIPTRISVCHWFSWDDDTCPGFGKCLEGRVNMDTDQALSLEQSRMVALTQSPEGRWSYQKVNLQNLRVGSDVETWLPREIWNKNKCSTKFTDIKAGGSNSTVSEMNNECPICLEKFSHGDHVSRFLCSHTLHFGCAKMWMTSRIGQGQTGTCPMCNFVVVTPVFQLAQPRNISQVQTLGLPQKLLSYLCRLCRGKTSQQRMISAPALTSR